MKPKLEILLHRRHTFRSSIIHNFSCHTGRRLPCWWSSCRTGCARPLSPAPTPPATASVASSLWWCMAAHHPRRPRHRRRQLRLQARISSRTVPSAGRPSPCARRARRAKPWTWAGRWRRVPFSSYFSAYTPFLVSLAASNLRLDVFSATTSSSS